jgi:hypothetical protein
VQSTKRGDDVWDEVWATKCSRRRVGDEVWDERGSSSVGKSEARAE